LWHQSVTSAFLSRLIGKLRGLPPESCFAAGLLHDIGSLLAAVNLEIFFAKRKLPPRPLSAWLSVIERFHVEVGTLAAQSWKLPRAVQDAIKFHHVVTREGCEHTDIVDVTTAADHVAYALEANTHVSVDAIEHLPYLRTEAERKAIVEALPKIPELIAAFESKTVDDGASMVEKKRPKRTRRTAKTRAPVLTNAAKPIQKFELLAAEEASLVVQSVFALAESFLVEMNVDDGKPFKLWAKVEACVQKGMEHEITLSPFALDLDRKSRWSAFVSAHG
jgi:hypothetical protein